MYLETGHKQNQNDSVHAVIERFAKNQTVYVPSQWFQIAKSACLKSPYKVKEMGISDFYDLDKLCRETSDNFNVDINGVKVNFTEIRVLKVDYTLPDMISVRTSWAAEDIKMIETIRRSRRGKLQRRSQLGRTICKSCILVQFQFAKECTAIFKIFVKKKKNDS